MLPREIRKLFRIQIQKQTDEDFSFEKDFGPNIFNGIFKSIALNYDFIFEYSY